MSCQVTWAGGGTVLKEKELAGHLPITKKNGRMYLKEQVIEANADSLNLPLGGSTTCTVARSTMSLSCRVLEPGDSPGTTWEGRGGGRCIEQ